MHNYIIKQADCSRTAFLSICSCLLTIVCTYRSRKQGPSKCDNTVTAKDHMTEDPHLEVPIHPNPAYCTVDNGAL